ncbi:efflux transporter outer membrane subunit [Acinetobacter sp. ANC 4648]|uniref:efflux transporter outer membrane subunit n=1 Tax=Acinetobacter sp. ANC 4648 TaxID=1977875 RepID=UPI000A34D4D9|nr:efflux transporter outer membrane subunit [Acinetobacter sp. ANC 4648]OTG82956.1 hypothetical protein B9T27_06720 [Acinetobacter sp. ANC 4648]
MQKSHSKKIKILYFSNVSSLAVLFIMGFSGCQMIKPEETPSVNIGQNLSSPSQYGLGIEHKKWETQDWKIANPSDSLPKGEWWQIFSDPQLNQLVDQLNRQNASIAQYQAQYRQALALIEQSRAGLFPTLAGNASMTRANSGSASVNSSRAISTEYGVDATVSWEPDLWGKVRQNILVNQDKAEASQADLNNIRLSMQSQLVSNYLQWVVQGFQLQSQKESIDNLKKSLTLTQNQYNAGIVASTIVDQAQSQYQAALASYTDMQLSQVQLQHIIAMLIAQPQDQLQLQIPQQLPALPQIPSSLPSSILQRRPDIASAERTMAAANAQVGVARLAFFPDFSLGGNIGFKSNQFSHLLNASNLVWSVGPVLASTILDGGLRKAQTAQARAAYAASAAQYKQTILSAIQNVEDNIAAQYLLSQQVNQQQQSLQAASRAEKTTMNQYRAGIVAYLNVLTAQNARITAQSSVWSIRSRQYVTTVNLISSMGGGWD